MSEHSSLVDLNTKFAWTTTDVQSIFKICDDISYLVNTCISRKRLKVTAHTSPWTYQFRYRILIALVLGIGRFLAFRNIASCESVIGITRMLHLWIVRSLSSPICRVDGSSRASESLWILKSLDSMISGRSRMQGPRSSRSYPDYTRGSSSPTIAHLRRRKSADNEFPSPLESERRAVVFSETYRVFRGTSPLTLR